MIILNYIASVSFGKDSLAMLLRLLDEDRQIDEVVFFDTGMEFNCIYKIMHDVKILLLKKGIKFTRLKASKEFIYLMFDHQINHRDGTQSWGYKWCGGSCRWFTTYKTNTIRKYLRSNYDEYIEYVGIALDEPKRIERSHGKILPLVDWKMTEKDCLDLCHGYGFYWQEGEHELYEYLDRVSCWCCRNKNLKELKNIYRYFKPYWFALCDLENRCGITMKNRSLRSLEEIWKNEIYLDL